MIPLQLLLVEDDEDDISFVREALQSNGVAYQMKEIMDGESVLPYLENCERLPDAIILDLNLPKIHGREVLKGIKGNGKLKGIPVIILTTSTSIEDKRYCALLGSEKFITKPTSLDEYDQIVETIIEQCIKEIKTS